jgi:hypothetical protein
MTYSSRGAKLLQTIMAKVSARNPDAPVFEEQRAEIRYTQEHAPYSVLEGASTGYGIGTRGYSKFDE